MIVVIASQYFHLMIMIILMFILIIIEWRGSEGGVEEECNCSVATAVCMQHSVIYCTVLYTVVFYNDALLLYLCCAV